MTIKYSERPYRIDLADCQALLVDIQERLTSHINEYQKLVDKATILIQGLQALNVPIMLNEQYPKGLGNTLPALSNLLDQKNQSVFEKITFSVCDNPEAWKHIASQNRNTVIVFGIEAHVCVMQTVLDLLDNGMQPVVIADAVGSRDSYDKKIAIRRIRRAGAVVTTTEAILFELCRGSDDPAFKTISNLVK